jgi:amino acid permease
MRKFVLITAVCFGMTLVLYEATAAAGYVLFGSGTQSDVISNFPDGFVPAVVARVALTLLLLFSYPLAFHAMRSNTAALLPERWAAAIQHGTRHAGARGDAEASGAKYTPLIEPSAEEGGGGVAHHAGAPSPAGPSRAASCDEWVASAIHMWPHMLLTALLVAVTVGVAIALPQISVILGYKGALLGSVIVFILPGLMHFSLVQQRLTAAGGKGGAALGVWSRRDLLTTQHGVLAVVFCAWGLCIMVLGTLTTAGVF